MVGKNRSSVRVAKQDYGKLYDEEYFERGLVSGKSCYINYGWLPELTIRTFYYMVKDLPIEDGSRILDFGCAKGYLVRAARILNFEAYGVDVSEYAISQVDKVVEPYCKLIGNGKNVKNLFGITFDWVISKDVFEHIPEEALPGILQDLASLTKKMFIIVPISEDDASGKFIIPEYDKDPTHFTIKSDRWWANLFEKNGFIIERMSYDFRYCKHNWTSIWPKSNAFYVLKRKIME
jgi:cyclopropane fatty-acyl-phospholipid synthase-like methyltransferase